MLQGPLDNHGKVHQSVSLSHVSLILDETYQVGSKRMRQVSHAALVQAYQELGTVWLLPSAVQTVVLASQQTA